jgi:hypothetical protein
LLSSRWLTGQGSSGCSAAGLTDSEIRQTHRAHDQGVVGIL